MKHALLWIHCITPLHNGGGESFGAVDRPIIRNSVTGHPYIQGSSIKGALRAAAKRRGNWEELLDIAFGPEDIGGEAGTGRQGALVFPDAELVFFPVRSLAGLFAWTTSLYTLSRLHWKLQLSEQLGTPLGNSVSKFLQTPTNLRDTALCGGSADQNSNIQESVLSVYAAKNKPPYYVLEGHILTADTDSNRRTAFGLVGKEIGTRVLTENFWQDFSKDRFIVCDEDVFTDMTRRGTAIEANIRINDDTGTAATGQLRYTEFLPAETILCAYCGIDESLARENTDPIFEKLQSLVGSTTDPEVLQIGADESKGKGIVRTMLDPTPLQKSAAAGMNP